jgi:hypothetical protein
MQDTNGIFYGSAPQGGAYSFGSIYSLVMGLPPFVTFVRANGKTGEQVQILGPGLTGTTKVTFDGIPANSFAVESDTFMTALVPESATTGKVVVTTPTGKLTSNVNFRIRSRPQPARVFHSPFVTSDLAHSPPIARSCSRP